MITLSHLGTKRRASRVICDLRKHGYSPILNEDPAECSFCRKHIPVINISGEQFLPENLHIRHELLTLHHTPVGLKDFMAGVIGRRVIKCNHPPEHSKHPYRTIYFDLKEMLQGSIE